MVGLQQGVESAVLLALPIDIVALFNDLPLAGIDGLFHHCGVKAFKKFRIIHALSEFILFLDSFGCSNTLLYAFRLIL
jgi:hypothetical protein